MCYLHACMSVCGYVYVDAHGGQKRVPSGPGVKVVVSQRQIRCRNINTLNCQIISLVHNVLSTQHTELVLVTEYNFIQINNIWTF